MKLDLSRRLPQRRQHSRPKTELDRPVPPSILKVHAADLWEEVWAILEPMKAGKSDGLLVARYCNALDHYRRAEAAPGSALKQEFEELLIMLEACLGLSPTDRARIGAPGGKPSYLDSYRKGVN